MVFVQTQKWVVSDTYVYGRTSVRGSRRYVRTGGENDDDTDFRRRSLRLLCRVCRQMVPQGEISMGLGGKTTELMESPCISRGY